MVASACITVLTSWTLNTVQGTCKLDILSSHLSSCDNPAVDNMEAEERWKIYLPILHILVNMNRRLKCGRPGNEASTSSVCSITFVVAEHDEIVGMYLVRKWKQHHCMKVINLQDWMKDVWRTESVHYGGWCKMTGIVYTKTAFPLNSYSDDAVWDVVLALWTVQLGLGNRVGTIGARF